MQTDAFLQQKYFRRTSINRWPSCFSVFQNNSQHQFDKRDGKGMIDIDVKNKEIESEFFLFFKLMVMHTKWLLGILCKQYLGLLTLSVMPES